MGEDFKGGILVLCSVICMGILLICVTADAYTDEEAIRCVIGESSGEGFEGMVAISEAIRNRGHLRGVYGCRARFVKDEPEWVWEKARKAWEWSLTTDLVGDATHWESIHFKKPYWAEGARITAKIGNHIFYGDVK